MIHTLYTCTIHTFMILSEFIRILFTLSMSLRESNLAAKIASIFLDWWSNTPVVIFFNELMASPFSLLAEWVLDRVCLLREALLTCAGVLMSGEDLSILNFVSFLFGGVQDAGLMLSEFGVGVVCDASLLATPPPASSVWLEWRGDVLQLAALAESAYWKICMYSPDNWTANTCVYVVSPTIHIYTE